MKIAFHRALTLTLSLAVAAALSSVAFAQDEEMSSNPSSKPRFVVLPAKPAPAGSLAPASSLTTWNGSYSYRGKTYTYNMVGLDPSTGSSVTIPIVVIPVKLIITTKTLKKVTFNPEHKLSNGKTVIQNVVGSPIFDMTTTYTQGGVDVGTTQYIDAYQRANFWGTVVSNPNYHVLLNPTVAAEQTLTVPATKGTVGNEFGIKAGKVDINWFDLQIQGLITKLAIQPNQFPIFVTYNTYLTSNGCCIGGYHSAVGAQTYTHATYVDLPGAFSQDVSALSHEIGEWMDDPLINGGNNSACGILENGDPLETTANYGDYPYPLNGFTYNLQDLATLPYFGAPASTTVNGYTTFQGTKLGICANGS